MSQLVCPDNQPIAYDFHGDIPLDTPFSKISPTDIHIYLDLDTNTGKNACGQNCQHCWFVNYEKVHKKSFSLEEGYQIKSSLNDEGYKVFARYVDSFSLQGEFMRIHGPAHNREFRQEENHAPTETMKKGDAWTSGRPLLNENYRELLDLAVASGYGTISITFHGLIDSQLQIRSEHYYPIKGTFSGSNTAKAIARIKEYNCSKQNEDPTFQPIRINIGATLNSVIDKTFGVNLDKEWFLAECGIDRKLPPTNYRPGGGVWIPPQNGILQKLPEIALPPFVLESQITGEVGTRFQGGVKSGLFLGGYVITGDSEDQVIENIQATAQWFNDNTTWSQS